MELRCRSQCVTAARPASRPRYMPSGLARAAFTVLAILTALVACTGGDAGEGEPCSSNDDCADPLSCGYWPTYGDTRCGHQCVETFECPSLDYVCESGYCILRLNGGQGHACTNQADCAFDYECVNWQPGPVVCSAHCVWDFQCSEQPTTGVCVDGACTVPSDYVPSGSGGSGGGSAGPPGSGCDENCNCPSTCTGSGVEQACLYCQSACLCACCGNTQCQQANCQMVHSLSGSCGYCG